MFKPSQHLLRKLRLPRRHPRYYSDAKLPNFADVVIVGGGSAGCHLLYYLAKRGVKVLLLERAKLTSGTTWHTAGLVWSLKRNPVDIELLASSRNLLDNLQKETNIDPGWIQSGSLFIAHTPERLNEYRSMSTLGKSLGVESHILDPKETKRLHPLLDETKFIGSLYSPGDGVVCPSMLCTALTKSAIKNGASFIENCEVQEVVTGENIFGKKRIQEVRTPLGVVKTNAVVNAAGVWANKFLKGLNISVPIVPMRHTYVATNPVTGVRNLPHIRDHDHEIYLRVQGDTFCFGGYEQSPTVIEDMPNDFHFGLYELDWSVFEPLIKNAVDICPQLGKQGIKTTICGPEAFTPDRKPIMGPDPRIEGLYHSCGFSAAGMMFGGGCAEQLAHWITYGRPDIFMYNYDVRRFHPELSKNKNMVQQLCVKAYSQNHIVRPQTALPLNIKSVPTINSLVKNKSINYVVDYDEINHEVKETKANGMIFDLSHASKFYIKGHEAEEAINWIFAAETKQEENRLISSCSLNHQGGIEMTATVTKISKDQANSGYYLVSYDCPRYQAYTHLTESIMERGLQAKVIDIYNKTSILSVMGPNSRYIFKKILGVDLTAENLLEGCYQDVTLSTGTKCKIYNKSLLKDFNLEIHLPFDETEPVYKLLQNELKTGLIQTYYSLANENGSLMWGYDIRTDDSPVEANLEHTCCESRVYKGKQVIEMQDENGVRRKLITLAPKEDIQLNGLEGIYRDGIPIGYIRRAGYSYKHNKSFGKGYIQHPEGRTIEDEFWKAGTYQIDVLGKMYDAEIFNLHYNII